jgi:hypothetical protein
MNTPTETTEMNHERPVRPGYWLRAMEHRKHALTRDYRAGLGEKAREGVSDEDYATTMATLEKMARNLGWDESRADERGHFGPRFAPGFGRGMGRPHFGHRGFGPGRPEGAERPGHSGHAEGEGRPEGTKAPQDPATEA